MPRLGQESDDLRRRGQQQGQGSGVSGDGSSSSASSSSSPSSGRVPDTGFSLSSLIHRLRIIIGNNNNNFSTGGGGGSMIPPPPFNNMKLNLRNIALMMVGIFILRNLLFNDYRKESIDSLKNSGMTDEEIDRIVPKTYDERVRAAKDKKDDIGKMKHDIEYLKNEVDDLKKARESVLGEMDELHLSKRKAHEEQIMKDHPNFKPSNNRLRKTTDGGGGDGGGDATS